MKSYDIAVHIVIEARSAEDAKAEVHKRLPQIWDSLPWDAGWVGYLVDEKAMPAAPGPGGGARGAP